MFLYLIFVSELITTTKYNIMTLTKSHLVQKQMNFSLANNSYKKAYKLFVAMNEFRAEEGLPFFTMPNLQKRFNDTKTSH